MKPIVLWTERPEILPREVETHEWMELHRPWEIFDLELVYDNAPGGWVHYCQTFRDVWTRCGREHRSLIVVESDVVPRLDAFREILACPNPVCMFPYQNFILGADGTLTGAVVETRVPGGWESHFARQGDEWAMDGDLGFARFRPEACAQPFPTDIDTGNQALLINTALFRMFKSKDWRDPRGRLHLHWQVVKNKHRYWDEGDFAHHPPGERERMKKAHAAYLDPSIR